MARRTAKAPPCGWTTKATVANVVDGDTLDVEVVRRLRVRLLDCWAPEKHETGRRGEKARGLAAQVFLEKLLAKHGREVTLFIQADEEHDLSAVLTLGRFLGRVWLAGGKELAKVMVEAGHAAETKEALLDTLREGQTP